MYHIVDHRLIKSDYQENKLPTSTEVFVYSELTKKEIALFADYYADKHERVKYCKAEEHYLYLSGTIITPLKDRFPETDQFSFCIKDHRLLLIDENGLTKQLLKRLCDIKYYQDPSPGRILADLIELIIEYDLDYLETIEDQIADIEDNVLNGVIEEFNIQMTMIKRETMHYFNFYNQLADMLDTLKDDISDRFIEKDKLYFSSIMHRCLRLQNNAQQLREYALQVNDEYQNQLNLRLNSVMKILTIITVVLMPLTLITGWYGMNFKFMPELEWQYGYLSVFVLAIIVLGLTLWWMKKKKIF